MNLKTVITAGAILLTAPAWAHHSFTMFDTAKTLTVNGVVKEFEWTNPHVWIHVVAPDDKGKPMEYSLEMQSIGQDMAAGWRADTVKPGDKISIEYHPLKDGTRGGDLLSATLSDGKRLGPPVRRQGAQD